MLTTFDLFPSLPIELRLHIWRLSLVPDEHTVQVLCKRGEHHISRQYVRYFCASRPNPAQLQVNHEARSEALRMYSPYFCTAHAPHSCIYLDTARDTVHLHESVLAHLSAAEHQMLKRLIVEVHDFLLFATYMMEALQFITGLKELVLMVMPLSVSPYRVSNGPGFGDREIVTMLQCGIVDCADSNPKWNIPRVKVVSGTGRTMGTIIIEQEDVEEVQSEEDDQN